MAKRGTSRPHPNRRGKHRVQVRAPEPLARAPRTDLAIRIADLDRLTLAGVQVVADALTARINESSSLDEIRLLGMKANLLRAMCGTHRAIRLLTTPDEGAMDISVDALPLTRMQLERCFLALLICDEPNRWPKRYRKNAWKAFAEKFFREQQAVGHLEPYREYFSPSGQAVANLREFSREMDVWEDEFQTLRTEIQNDDPDPRWRPRSIADMPTPGKTLSVLTDPDRRKLAEVIYPYYDSLSHFSHGGLVGIMEAAILRGEIKLDGVGGDARQFTARQILQTFLPQSYVSMLVVATLFAEPVLAEEPDVAEALRTAWCPYHCDGSLLGIAAWDCWVGSVLDPAGERAGQPAE